MQFVVSTSLEKPNPELRKFIRSHVMLGKNEGKGKGEKRPYKKRQTKKRKDIAVQDHDDTAAGPLLDLSPAQLNTLKATVPAKFGSDMATISFADKIEPYEADSILHFSTIAKQILFPLEPCIFFDRRVELWIAPLTFDPAYLHVMIFTTYQYFHRPRYDGVIDSLVLPHLVKALRILQRRFADGAADPASLSFTTAATVFALAGYAHIAGDTQSARLHLEGLKKIMRLKGGMDTFRSNPKLLAQILRCDIGITLRSGTKPLFFFDSENSKNCFWPYPDLAPLLSLCPRSNSKPQIPFPADTDTALVQIWKVMADICTIVNYAVKSSQVISMETILEVLGSTFYRLVGLHFDLGSINEAVRLGLLAFASGVFLHWQRLGKPYSHLASKFRECFYYMKTTTPPRLRLWLLMAAAVSVFDPTDNHWLYPMLLDNLTGSTVHSWADLRGLLESFMWVNLVYDKPGEAIYNAIL